MPRKKRLANPAEQLDLFKQYRTRSLEAIMKGGRIEPAKANRTCQTCGRTIERKEVCFFIYQKGSICADCVKVASGILTGRIPYEYKGLT